MEWTSIPASALAVTGGHAESCNPQNMRIAYIESLHLAPVPPLSMHHAEMHGFACARSSVYLCVYITSKAKWRHVNR